MTGATLESTGISLAYLKGQLEETGKIGGGWTGKSS